MQTHDNERSARDDVGMTGAHRPVIRTPDQRIRVFVSSTLRELADERRAARAAIERMRLAPVMFELGARPHPPRDLYRSYLQQSDIFVGIYWESYGWVAPDEQISGLQDEYDLAPATMPKLIYIKASDNRDDRLKALISRIQTDDHAAYLPFHTAEELEERIADDLATLLAERFDAAAEEEEDAEIIAAGPGHVPAPYTTTIGREEDVRAVRDLLAVGAERVLSLIGPGGIGKSRLAIEVARTSADIFPDGIYFVLLEGVFERGLLLPTIAYSLGVRDSGAADLEDRIAQALAGKRVLIVLDNFEQIVDAATDLVRLYSALPLTTFLVTSRVVLRIRGERVYEVEPLSAPAGFEPATMNRAQHSSAVALFVDRARAVKPGFELTEANVGDVVSICRRLDGLPLAIELAAAKVRALQPSAIDARLGQSLPLLSAPSRDLPERHRTMRAAIDWSISLLLDVERDMLEDLGVFATRFTLEAVEAMSVGRSWEGQVLDALGGLVDASLVKQVDVGGRSTFSLLAIVREYALGRLKERGGADAMRRAHADYYAELVRTAGPNLRGARQTETVRLLGLELSNLRAAVRHLVYTDRLDDAGDFAWNLFVYWWISGFFSEVRLWMLELVGKSRPISTRTKAIAAFFTVWGEMWRRPSEQVIAGLGEASRLFAESGDDQASAMALAARGSTRMRFPDLDMHAAQKDLKKAREELHRLGDWWTESLTDVGLGLLALARGAFGDGRHHFERALAVAVEHQDAFMRVVAGNNVARMDLLAGETAAAERGYRTALELAATLHYDEGAQYALEGMSAIAAIQGDAWRAGALAAVTESIRQRVGVFDVEGFAANAQPLAAARESDPEAVAAGERAGADMSIAEAFAVALPDADESLREALTPW
jgi:predicted ATPase